MTADSTVTDLPKTLFGMTNAAQGGTLLFFPDFGGSTLYARPLVQLLGQKISCVGVRFAPDMIDALAHLSIEEICDRLAKDIETATLKRPVHLLGFSFAACLAFETARAMAQRGVMPDNLWVLDLPAPVKLRLRDVLRRPVRHAKLSYRQLRHNWRSTLFGRHDPMILHRYGIIGFDLRNHPESYRFIIRHLYAAFAKYRARRTAAPMTVLRALDGHAGPADLGWQAFCAVPVKTHVVPGDHLSILRTPAHAEVVANLILASFADQDTKERDGKPV